VEGEEDPYRGVLLDAENRESERQQFLALRLEEVPGGLGIEAQSLVEIGLEGQHIPGLSALEQGIGLGRAQARRQTRALHMRRRLDPFDDTRPLHGIRRAIERGLVPHGEIRPAEQGAADLGMQGRPGKQLAQHRLAQGDGGVPRERCIDTCLFHDGEALLRGPVESRMAGEGRGACRIFADEEIGHGGGDRRSEREHQGARRGAALHEIGEHRRRRVLAGRKLAGERRQVLEIEARHETERESLEGADRLAVAGRRVHEQFCVKPKQGGARIGALLAAGRDQAELVGPGRRALRPRRGERRFADGRGRPRPFSTREAGRRRPGGG
jgi:hypothetical protein